MLGKINKFLCRNHASALALTLATTVISVTFSTASGAVTPEAPVPPPLPSYARVADLVTSAATIATFRVRAMTLVPAERAPGLVAGRRRFLVEAETLTLIRSKDVLARQISFVVDLPDNGDRKAPKWKGRVLLAFGRIDQRVDFFQLQASSALFAWSPDLEAMVRRIASELAAPDAPPVIKRINSVFHVSGAVEGEGETQVFLDTENGTPISLSIVRRPDEKPQFGAALGEIVDQAASLPAPATPLWYRLACALPDALPARALTGQAPADASAASRDYKAFIAAMAPCDRSEALLN